MYQHIGGWGLPVDAHFHTVIAPISVEWARSFTREHAPTLVAMLLALAYRRIDAPELEQVVVAKLDEENIYRYANLGETAALYNALSQHPRFIGSSLLDKLQQVIYQQKNYYAAHPEMMQAIQEGVANVEAAGKKLKIGEAHKQIA